MEEQVVCPRCRQPRLPREFQRNARERSGRQKWCKRCQNAYTRGTPEGVGAWLRFQYGVEEEDSIILARKLLHPYTRCHICGLPNRIRATYVRERKMSIFGRRMTVDHIDPAGGGSLSNLRPLCAMCNRIRGAAMYTDEEVLRKVRRWWTKRFTQEELFWLNDRPGVGGNPLRGSRHEVHTD